MAKKQTTIDDLAVIVKKGFYEVDHKMATMATKEMAKNLVNDLAVMVQKGFVDSGKKIDGLKSDIDGLKSDMVEVNDRLDSIDDRLDRIEKIFSVDHKNRIERLEFEVKNLKDLFALK